MLPSCSTTRSLGVEYVEGESLEFFVPLCDGERLLEIRLVEYDAYDESTGETDRGDVLWSLNADRQDARTLDRVAIGDHPEGYRVTGARDLQEVVGLSVDSAQLRVEFETDEPPPHGRFFDLSDLPPDGSGVLLEGGTDADTVMSTEELQRKLNDECDPFKSVGLVSIGLGGASLVAGGWLLWRRMRRRGESTNQEPFPGH